jgi:hypothetical protein
MAAVYYQALDHLGPVVAFISRREFATPASTSIFLAKSHSKPGSRLRYARIFGSTASPDSMSLTTRRMLSRQRPIGEKALCRLYLLYLTSEGFDRFLCHWNLRIPALWRRSQA